MRTGLAGLLAEHRAAVDHFLDKAAAIGADRWHVPRAEGKWTPAEETQHLVLTYQAFSGDLRGERRMGLKGTRARRWLWKLIGLTAIIYARRIPKAVRAPREVRPDGATGTRDALVAALAAEAGEFEALFTATWNERPGTTVTHPFFGPLDLRQAIHLAAVHTRHHAAFLPGSRAV